MKPVARGRGRSMLGFFSVLGVLTRQGSGKRSSLFRLNKVEVNPLIQKPINTSHRVGH